MPSLPSHPGYTHRNLPTYACSWESQDIQDKAANDATHANTGMQAEPRLEVSIRVRNPPSSLPSHLISSHLISSRPSTQQPPAPPLRSLHQAASLATASPFASSTIESSHNNKIFQSINQKLALENTRIFFAVLRVKIVWTLKWI